MKNFNLILFTTCFFLIVSNNYLHSEICKEKTVILGAGPAGLTAAIYAARAEFHPLVIEGSGFEGQLLIAQQVENYPGFNAGISGSDLVANMRQQAEAFGAEIKRGKAVIIDLYQYPFYLKLDDETECYCETLIIATGASPKNLGLASEKNLIGAGVSYCATCDGPFFRGKEIVVVGGGDAAVEEALFLSRFASKVTIIHRRKEFSASKLLQTRMKQNQKICVITDSTIIDMLGEAEKKLSGVLIKNVITGEVVERPCQGVFIAIGYAPNTAFLKGQLNMDENGYLITAPNSTAASIPGVFAAGDVADKCYKQAITAAAFGCMAAIDSIHFLDNLNSPSSQQCSLQKEDGNAEVNDQSCDIN
jgi:thioredoxin reductase (NADPH)